MAVCGVWVGSTEFEVVFNYFVRMSGYWFGWVMVIVLGFQTCDHILSFSLVQVGDYDFLFLFDFHGRRSIDLL